MEESAGPELPNVDTDRAGEAIIAAEAALADCCLCRATFDPSIDLALPKVSRDAVTSE